MKMNTVKWGIIGCGNVTEVKSGPAFNLVDGSELVAVMRRNYEKAKDYAERHKVPKYYSNASRLINDPDINAVYVATPPDTHARYAIEAMTAGKPVYVEKPMARNYAECQRMLEVSQSKKVPLYVAYYRRALPGFRKVKELIEQGKIGDVRGVNIQLFKSPSGPEKSGNPGWRVEPKISGGGHFFDLSSHQLDYLDYLFGPVKGLQSFVTNQAGLYNAEDYVTASFTFKNEIVCSGTWCFSCSDESNRDIIEIFGDKGVITFSCFGFTPILLKNSEGCSTFEYPRPPHVQYCFIKEMVQELRGKENKPGNGTIAARTSWVMERVVKDYYRTNDITFNTILP